MSIGGIYMYAMTCVYRVIFFDVKTTVLFYAVLECKIRSKYAVHISRATGIYILGP